MIKRGFKIIKAYEGKGLSLPYRSTTQAAGYDFEAAEDMVLPSFWKELIRYFFLKITKVSVAESSDEGYDAAKALLKPKLVPTGIKAYMQPDEYLQLTNRSSNPLKKFLVLPNGVGIVDADYYDNTANEGHIFFQLLNFGLKDYQIKKGERVGQGIFQKYLIADTENNEKVTKRTGGFGSSGL